MVNRVTRGEERRGVAGNKGDDAVSNRKKSIETTQGLEIGHNTTNQVTCGDEVWNCRWYQR